MSKEKQNCITYSKSEQKTRLSYTRVSNKKQFEKIVAV